MPIEVKATKGISQLQIAMEAMKAVYGAVRAERPKERFDMLLEPMQAMSQLALLGSCPTGTKLSITNNILVVQLPTWNQGLIRSYNSDKKEDLVYIFNVIKRFKKFYGPSAKSHELKTLYPMLVERGAKGIEALVQTYSQSTMGSLAETLRMYAALLRDAGVESGLLAEAPEHQSVESVFSQVTALYKPDHYRIIESTLNMAMEDAKSHQAYVDGMNRVLSPLNSQIREWISKNIIL